MVVKLVNPKGSLHTTLLPRGYTTYNMGNNLILNLIHSVKLKYLLTLTVSSKVIMNLIGISPSKLISESFQFLQAYVAINVTYLLARAKPSS